jgi:SAM-dependent methyltransferase
MKASTSVCPFDIALQFDIALPLRSQGVGQQSGGAVWIWLGTVAGRSQAQLDGFKSRELRAPSASKGRHWQYELDWLRTTAEVPPASAPTDLHILVVGNLPLAVSRDGHMLVESNDESNLANYSWKSVHSVLFTGSLHQSADSTAAELRAIDGALRLLQAIAKLEPSPAVWLCTRKNQPIAGHTTTHAHAGLWGLARACRMENAQLPAWCVDVHSSMPRLAEMAHHPSLRRADGSVRGLHLSKSIEPEAAYCRTSLHVPRLIAKHDAQPVGLDVTFDDMRQLLFMHTSEAMAALDMEKLDSGYQALEALCQQYVQDGIHAVLASEVPVWHHKLLYEWCAKQLPGPSDSKVTSADVREIHPDMWAETQLAEKLGPRFAEMLSSTVAYQEHLFPGGSMESVLPVYEDAPLGKFYNGCVVAAVTSILSLLPTGRKITVLEVGAGSGGTASSLLSLLDGRCKQYIFTDVSNVFIVQARKRFAEFKFLEYELCNIDADPRSQGFALHQCDIVIGTNVLHATPFMVNTLSNCARLLRPGGFVVANELQYTSAFFQTTFGLTDGWWFFSEVGDAERVGQNSPLLCWRQWQGLLMDSGFCKAHCMQGDRFLRGQAVLVAQTPSTLETCESTLSKQEDVQFISGGLGGLGLLTARLLVEAGEERILLSSRSDKVVTGSESDWEWLAACSSDVKRVRCDAADEISVRRVLRTLASDGLSLRGVFHAAHALADATLANQQALNFRATYGPKVHAGAALLLLWRTSPCASSMCSLR